MSTEQMMTAAVMETAKAPVGVFALPSGYLDLNTGELHTAVDVREMSGREEDMLSSKQVPEEKKLSALLASCVTRVGPYTERGRIAAIVEELTVGDRVYLLLAIRRVTLGDELPVREECPECKVKNLFVIDLSDLATKPMADPRKRIFDVTLPSGKSARFRVSTGADEARVAKLQKRAAVQMDGISQLMLMRLELLNGEPPSLDAVKDLGLRDRQYLRDQFEEVEGGVDTAIQLECPSCGHEWERDLGTASANFFSRSGTRKR